MSGVPEGATPEDPLIEGVPVETIGMSLEKCPYTVLGKMCSDWRPQSGLLRVPDYHVCRSQHSEVCSNLPVQPLSMLFSAQHMGACLAGDEPANKAARTDGPTPQPLPQLAPVPPQPYSQILGPPPGMCSLRSML